MLSMTGFGEGTAESERLEVVVTLRSVNHRFLDLALRVPEDYRSLESSLAQRLRESLGRGRVELRLTARRLGARRVDVTIDEAVAQRYIEASNNLSEREGISRELSSGDLLRLPEVAVVSVASTDLDEGDRDVVGRALDQALHGLIEAKAREGEELAGVLGRVLGDLREIVAELDRSRSGLQQELAARTRTRLEELTGELGLDEVRLAQEIAILADRSDIQEELDRLRVHLERFESLLAAQDAVGKQLDFLAQEILRELNTIGSKCRNSQATQQVVDGKVRCEQLREQVQNVE